jgi:hypothetical protein
MTDYDGGQGARNGDGPANAEPSVKSVVRQLSVNFSIGVGGDNVKLLEEIISAFSPQKNFSTTNGENGPGGIRTRIRTLTESCAAVAPRALMAVLRSAQNEGKSENHILLVW